MPDIKSNKPLIWKIILNILTIIIIFTGIIFIGYNCYIANTNYITAINMLQKELAQTQSTITTTITDFQQSKLQITEQLKNQTQIIDELHLANRTTKEDLHIYEAEYLAKVANNSVQFENNITLAVKLLQLADQEIAKLSDPNLYVIREALAIDLADLRQNSTIDITGIYLQLAALKTQLTKLQLINQLTNNQKINPAISNQDNLSWWQKGLNKTWETLQHIIVVRKIQSSVPPFIPPEQQNFFYENLQTELTAAQWGLLHRQSSIYLASLKQTEQWIKQYAIAESELTRNILTELEKLQVIDVDQKTFAVLGSLQAFQGYFNKQ